MIDGKDTVGYDSLFESVCDIAQRVHALNHDALRAYAPVVESILLFETLHDGTHRLKIALQKLQTLETIRIIEGKA